MIHRVKARCIIKKKSLLCRIKIININCKVHILRKMRLFYRDRQDLGRASFSKQSQNR